MGTQDQNQKRPKMNPKKKQNMKQKLNKLQKAISEIKTAPKAWDIQTATSVSYAGTIGCISALNGVGDQEGNRDGNSVRFKSLFARFCITGTQSTLVNEIYNKVRVIVFMDKSTNGVVPLVSDVITVAGSVMSPLSPLNYNNRKRFKILYDNLDCLAALGVATAQFGAPFTLVDKMYIKLNKTTTYLDTGATASALGQNHYYYLFISDSAGSPNPSFEWYSRMKYIE